MSIPREINYLQSETVADVNSHFVLVTEKEVLKILDFLDCVALPPSFFIQLFQKTLS